MDLGISGRTAILLASSRGLGRACAESLAREGVHLVLNGRSADDVEKAAADIRSTHGVSAVAVVGDVSDPRTHDVNQMMGLGPHEYGPFRGDGRFDVEAVGHSMSFDGVRWLMRGLSAISGQLSACC